jgi:hypothetical protein
MKTKGLFIPFICFHLFFRIGVFQWFTTDSNKLFPISRAHAKLCATVMPGRASAAPLAMSMPLIH